MLPLFVELVSETDEARREFETHPAVMDAVAQGMSLERYRRLLLELYHIVWHFNPICAAAASRIDDARRQVRYFLYDHMAEESGHEEWVMNDLAAVGVDAATALAHEPSIAVQSVLGYNYWNADRREPCAVLGMMYTLEVIASVYGGPFSAAMKEALLLEGDRGISFIGSHASLDAEHMADLRLVLNTIDDEAIRKAVIASVKTNLHHVTRVFVSV